MRAADRPLIEMIVDLDPFEMPLSMLLPAASVEALEPWRALFDGEHIDYARGMLRIAIKSHVVRVGGATILVDACVGEHKDRPQRPDWHQRRGTGFLEKLSRVGCRLEDIDIVMCTHLHADHVGWNTRLDNGRWIPTFPNARYVFSRKDYEFFKVQTHEAHNREAYFDSVLPVIEAGQADIVDSDHLVHREIEDGIWLQDAAGHSPGCVVVNARRGGSRAMFMGDVIHHPIQLVRPDLAFFADEDRAEACATRQCLLAEAADCGAILLPAHFPDPPAGRVRRAGKYFAYDFKK